MAFVPESPVTGVDVLVPLRSGRPGRIAFALGGRGLLLEASRSVPSGARAELRGFAFAHERPHADDPDGLDPARTVRRALADGRMSAADIDYAVASAAGGRDRAAAALRRGLGRFAATMTLEVAEEPLAIAAERIGRAGSAGGSVALVIQPGLGSIAVAFGRP